jgi:hypothetical protein
MKRYSRKGKKEKEGDYCEVKSGKVESRGESG